MLGSTSSIFYHFFGPLKMSLKFTFTLSVAVFEIGKYKNLFVAKFQPWVRSKDVFNFCPFSA